MKNKLRTIIPVFIFFAVLLFVSQNLFASEIVNKTVADTLNIETTHAAIEHQLPQTFMVVPFILLLLMIATGPLFYKHFWEHHYPKVSVILGAIVVAYYIFFCKTITA